MQLYCEDMMIAAKRVNAETSTVSGSGTVTGSAPRCAVVNMKGRTFNESSPLHSAAQLDALLRGIRTLIKLSGQVLHGEDEVTLLLREFLLIDKIYRWLGEHSHQGFTEHVLGQVLDVVTHQLPDADVL